MRSTVTTPCRPQTATTTRPVPLGCTASAVGYTALEGGDAPLPPSPSPSSSSSAAAAAAAVATSAAS
eukprot:16252-Heterococcus_DN1.PRE.2